MKTAKEVHHLKKAEKEFQELIEMAKCEIVEWKSFLATLQKAVKELKK